MPFDPDSLTTSTSVSRRRLLKLLGLGPAALTITAAGSRALAAPVRSLPFRSPALEPAAAGWQTWLVPSANQLLPPRPRNIVPGPAEIRELLQLQAERGDTQLGIIQFWDHQGGAGVWTQALLENIKSKPLNPVLASRALALLHTAMADAAVASWAAKYRYGRFQPVQVEKRLRPVSEVPPQLPGYPSEHAAIAVAASGVLDYLFPGGAATFHGQPMAFEDAATEAAQSRMWAGVSVRSDMDAGMKLGQRVCELAVHRGESDGSDAVWDTTTQPGRLTGPEQWVPTPPAFAFPPLLPLAGTWRPWLLSSGSLFRPGMPPALDGAFPSAQFLQEAQEVKDAVDHLTPDQRQIALFWADDPGATYTPPGHWANIALTQVGATDWSTPRAARAMGLVGAALADAAIACWDAKYTYWVVRPITAIRTLAGYPFSDPNFNTVIATPAFPSYTSGHSTFSGAAADVLSYLIPGGRCADAFGQNILYRDAADQAALSRLLGGIHYRSDNEEGLTCGRKVAQLAVQRARKDRGA